MKLECNSTILLSVSIRKRPEIVETTNELFGAKTNSRILSSNVESQETSPKRLITFKELDSESAILVPSSFTQNWLLESTPL